MPALGKASACSDNHTACPDVDMSQSTMKRIHLPFYLCYNFQKLENLTLLIKQWQPCLPINWQYCSERMRRLFQVQDYKGSLKDKYGLLCKQLDALLEGEEDQTANLSNAAALLNQFLTDVNWTGFYLWKNDELVLGPFQGLPACVRIPSGKGVCGTAAKEKRTLRIEDVHQFPGHIACDAASNSEIVIPVLKDSQLIGVLDIDSPSKNRFSEIDEDGLTSFVSVLVKHL